MKSCYLTSLCGIILLAASSASATIVWTEWNSATTGLNGSASGTMGAITVSYTGEVASSTQVNDTGINYWNPATPYLSTTVPNAPDRKDIITLDFGAPNGNFITFSAPVYNPIMLIVSLGRTNAEVRYTFNQDFTILSQGTGYWGGTASSLTNIDGNILSGKEGHGAIQFDGWVSEISWLVDPREFWHGFTIGTSSEGGPISSPVPEPSTYGLLGALLLAGMIAVRRLRHRRF